MYMELEMVRKLDIGMQIGNQLNYPIKTRDIIINIILPK